MIDLITLVLVNHVTRQSPIRSLAPNSSYRETLGAPISGLCGLYFCTRKWRCSQPSLNSFRTSFWVFRRCAWIKQTNIEDLAWKDSIPTVCRAMDDEEFRWTRCRRVTEQTVNLQVTVNKKMLFYCNLLQTSVILTTFSTFFYEIIYFVNASAAGKLMFHNSKAENKLYISKKSSRLPTWYLRSSFPGKPKYFSAWAEPSNRRGDKKQDQSIILMIIVTPCSLDRDKV